MANPMASEAYSIIDKTLQSGGRGSTTTQTDYSGISDAMMKKASLETQIGGMLMDQNMARASLMGQMEMHKADLYMQKAQLDQQDAHFQQQRKDAADADKMSPFEQITGVLAGAAAPAAAGFAVGGPVGAVVGGVAGGAMTMGAGNSRTRQQNIIGNLGTISQAAVTIKGFSNQAKAADSSAELMKGVNSISGIFRSSDPTSEEFQGAQQQLDSYVGKYTQDQIKAGRPMGEVYKEAAAIKKEALQGFDPNDKDMVAARGMQSLITKAKSDEAFLRGDEQAVNQFKAKAAGLHYDMTGSAPTLEDMQVLTARANYGVAERHFKGKSLSAMPDAENGGGNVSSGGGPTAAQGPTREVQGTSGTSTMNMNRGTPDGGLSTENYVVPSAAPNVSAGSMAWGTDMDNGPQQMMQEASTNFNQAAAKDPTIIDKALNQEPVEMPKPGLEERALDFLNVTGNHSDRKKELEKERADTYQNKITERRNAEFKKEMQRPADFKTKAPVEYKTASEKVFKEQPDKIVEAFQIKKKFGYDSTLVETAHNFESTAVQIKDFEGAVDNLGNADKEFTVGQMKTFQHFMQGQGEGAMEGSSSGVAGSGGGASVQLNKSEFKRNLEVQMQKAGEMGDLSPDQVDKLYAVYQRQAPLVNILARSVGQEKGPLSEGDKAPFKQALFNNYDPDIRRNKTGAATMMDILYNNFETSFGEGSAFETWEDKSAREGAYKRSNFKPSSTPKPYRLFD